MTAQHLREILDTVRQQRDLIPHDGITFCNIALDRILGLCGIPRMTNRLTQQPLMANDMIDCMAHSPSLWEKVNGDTACARASQGVVVVACQQEEGHGHVAVCYPIPESFSASWGKHVPMLNNIGKRNDVLRSSQCFRTEPDYYSQKI